MSAGRNRLAGMCLVPLLSVASVVAAAGTDLRLVNAAGEQDKAAVRALLKTRGVDVNAARPDGVTALLWAAHWNDLETVDLLLQAGAKVNAAEEHGVTPLAEACGNISVAMVDKLLKAGANPNAARTSGLTPLMTAVSTGGNVQVVKMLLAHGADVNAATDTKYNALMWAVADQYPDVARLLIEAHADVHAASAKGFTPLLLAAKNGDIEMAKILLAAGVNVNEIGSDPIPALPYSIISGQTQFARFLIDQGADVNANLGGVTALHAAAGSVGLWLEDWNRSHGGPGGYSAGAGGAGGGDLGLVKALLEHGANPNARTTSSAMLMSYIGRPTKGAFEPFACGTGDLRGATPLWIAAYSSNGSVGGFGGDGGAGAAAAGAVADAGAGAVAAAPAGGGRGGRGAAPGGGGRGGRGAGSGADVIQALVAAGADLRLTTDDGTTPLMAAAGLGRSTFSPGKQRGDRSPNAEAAVKTLLDAGADVNAVNEADFTALHGAAFRGLDEVIQILVEHGANINARDYRGRTPYRLAEGSKQSFQFQAYPETTTFLKGLGADVNLGVPGTVQERMRDIPAANQQQQ